MSDAKVKVGILGAGAMGGEHAYCFGEIENAEVAGVFSRNPERAEAAAKICNAEAVSDPFAIINDGTIDAIDICLP